MRTKTTKKAYATHKSYLEYKNYARIYGKKAGGYHYLAEEEYFLNVNTWQAVHGGASPDLRRMIDKETIISTQQRDLFNKVAEDVLEERYEELSPAEQKELERLSKLKKWSTEDWDRFWKLYKSGVITKEDVDESNSP